VMHLLGVLVLSLVVCLHVLPCGFPKAPASLTAWVVLEAPVLLLELTVGVVLLEPPSSLEPRKPLELPEPPESPKSLAPPDPLEPPETRILSLEVVVRALLAIVGGAAFLSKGGPAPAMLIVMVVRAVVVPVAMMGG